MGPDRRVTTKLQGPITLESNATDLIRLASGPVDEEVSAHIHRDRPLAGEKCSMSFVELLRQAKMDAMARSADPWRLPLERVQGDLGYDGVERISTQALLDYLEVPQGGRKAGACRRLAKLMRELGWTPVKARALGQSGFRDQVRGYAWDTKILSA